MSEIEIEDYSLDFQDPAALSASVQAADQAASQATSAPQDPPIEPAAASRGRRPSRDAAARTSRRRTTPSPPPSRRPPPSPASSYASALSSAPAKAKWTVVGLRQALASSGVIIPRRSTKADLLTLYASLQAGENPGSAPPSRASGGARTSRCAPYARPEQSTTPPRTASRPSGRSEGPSASRGHAPKAAVASHCPPSRPSERELAAHTGGEPVFASTSRNSGASPPPPAAISRSQLLPRCSPNPLPFPWPAAPLSSHSMSIPPPTAQAPVPPIPPLFPSLSSAPGAVPSVSLPFTTHALMPAIPPLFPSLSSAPGAVPSVSLPLTTHAPTPAIPPLFPPFSSFPQNAHSASMPPPAVPAALFPPQTRSPFSLASATPLPAPPNALALEPPPVPNSIRTQILAGADVDLFSLLSPISPSPADRQINCGDFSVTLKNSAPTQSRILSFAEFTIAFTRYSEVICAAFPHRRRELSDYLTIVAELALSYGGSHFYTYHKLFAAKCAIRVAQWNQCPYWGALDTELHNRVFLGCRNISCAVCRSFSHPTISCPFINPSIPPCPEPSQPKSTSYVPRLMDTPATPSPTFRRRLPSTVSQVCASFNSGRCTRQRCQFMHVCNFCGGAHARLICPVQKAANKNSKKYLSTPVNISRLSVELLHHPDSLFTDYVLSGLAHGFHPGVVSLPSQSLICPNLHSALTEPEIVDLLVKKEIDANFMIGPYAVPPFPIFRVSPIGVATRKFSGKKRLIIDLSSPHNSPFPSINSLIPLEEFSLHYHDVDQAITLIKDAGRGAWLAKVDITSAFKVMPIHPDFWHLFGIRWKNEFYFAVRLTFGCRSSPKIFDTLSEAICWILSNNYNIPYLIHLLDDFLIVSPPDSVPAAHLLTIQKLFSELGIPLAQDKTEGPSTSIEFLGINLDSQKFLASLPKEKIDRTIVIASTLLTNTSCSKRELLSILGHLNFAMRIIPQGRPFISHLLSLASSAHALEDRISINDSCRSELSLWISFLKQWNGLSFFYSNLVSSPIDIQLYTDDEPEIVDLLVKKEIDANFMIGPYAVPPFPIFRVSPIGVATRKFSGKKRLIIDLSSPHNSPFPSINSLIPLEEFSLHYHDVDQAITLIKDAGRGAWLAKVDITSAFKVMPIHPDFWHLFGIRWKNEFYFAVRLTFGCRSSPKIFDTLSEAICWILSNNYNIPYLIHLLDDFLIVSPPDSVPAAHLLTTQKLFQSSGFPSPKTKPRVLALPSNFWAST
ncbi:poly [Labeo rohita]|uniref:ribonuclease H n=1 Tax=Labeo rohita TaxID=84645 RepID=A0A498P4I6_LABRO|nr:poly [Labeo rohita]